MKLIYSELQKLLPNLNKDPQTLRDDLTMIGHFTNFYEKIDNDIVFDFREFFSDTDRYRTFYFLLFLPE